MEANIISNDCTCIKCYKMIKTSKKVLEVMKMKLFQSILDWKAIKEVHHREKMQSLGKCPDCNGRGFTPAYLEVYSPSFDCSGCEGSGMYSDWERTY